MLPTCHIVAGAALLVGVHRACSSGVYYMHSSHFVSPTRHSIIVSIRSRGDNSDSDSLNAFSADFDVLLHRSH
ncbi:hypothetical protein DFJ58DRAFT_767822 [Suillus subalutaceus]|uniref:uncharacterized protein n=1 Tax=Suillus subalutaceus TaxID=48586 RepID=UPI001B87CD70|nr:uncharacterized protein DFJ58DRAFT_767822 [Suillus subalutaceus]KAG1867782.1 hypothetical protein DFJ58DRAFT_767822 [Suillus subalutaceus]